MSKLTSSFYLLNTRKSLTTNKMVQRTINATPKYRDKRTRISVQITRKWNLLLKMERPLSFLDNGTLKQKGKNYSTRKFFTHCSKVPYGFCLLKRSSKRTCIEYAPNLEACPLYTSIPNEQQASLSPDAFLLTKSARTTSVFKTRSFDQLNSNSWSYVIKPNIINISNTPPPNHHFLRRR
jgi:hypothetical protein